MYKHTERRTIQTQHAPSGPFRPSPKEMFVKHLCPIPHHENRQQFDLDRNIDRDHLLIKGHKFEASGVFLTYPLHNVWETNMTFDLYFEY